MSYGVLSSKSVHVLVETVAATGATASDAALLRFQGAWGSTWVAGRLTTTTLHLTFMPTRAARGASMLTVDLREVSGVEVGGGRVSRAVGVRTPAHVLRIRCLGAPALAEQRLGVASVLLLAALVLLVAGLLLLRRR